ncbi:hypothetical protein DBR23_13170 [Acidovorax sp. HMWF018]|nr:hypothetical protein DBR23_13170 [Acidovorax sp. HMWF018]
MHLALQICKCIKAGGIYGDGTTDAAVESNDFRVFGNCFFMDLDRCSRLSRMRRTFTAFFPTCSQ